MHSWWYRYREDVEAFAERAVLNNSSLRRYGRAIENDAALERVQAGEVLKGLSEARTQRFFLHSYSRYGIDVRSESDSKDDRFISWGAILSIWGPSREELIRGHREAMQRQEDSEGSEPL